MAFLTRYLKTILAFITICFVLQQYELNLCDPSDEKKKKLNALHCFDFHGLDFLLLFLVFSISEMSARG